jgi:putative addiction module component (TIGR02574 family)
MVPDLATLSRQALTLPPASRVRLTRKLLRSLEADELDEAECNRVWAAEAERRLGEVRRGRVKCIPGPEVLREVRARRKR